MHGTLERIPLTWKFNSKQLLSKTLNSRMNIIETRAVLNIVKTDRKWSPEAKREGHRNIDYRQTNIQILSGLWFVSVTPSQRQIQGVLK